MVTDLHLSDPAAGGLGHGSKLLVESQRIFAQALEGILAEAPRFVIVPGDLTKDGERASHQIAARMLGELRRAGIGVYVVPGNHDIANPRADPPPSVTPEQFAELYEDFGYGSALRRDPSSLSYVAEPAPGIWLLALDSCSYRRQAGSMISSGSIGAASRQWIAESLGEARARGVRVLAFLHHGVVEHFRGQKAWLGNYVIDDYDAISGLLAQSGVRAAFTGHGHAQDITRRSFPGAVASEIYDVETAATVSWPNAWRSCELGRDGRLAIRSHFVTTIQDGPVPFPDYARERARAELSDTAGLLLRRALIGNANAASLAADIADAGLAFWRGDEPRRWRGFASIGLDLWASLFAGGAAQTLRDLRTDLPPADNDVTLSLGELPR